MSIDPILGILSMPRANGNPFPGGQNESFCEILTVAERINCVAYVFSPFDIDWSKGAVWGYRFDWRVEPGNWERHLYPLPTVIYNRIPNRTLENRNDVKNILTQIREIYGPRFFNPCFLDKWKTHTILCTNKHTSPFLPETAKLEGPGTIRSMLERYDSVYLKPTANSLGNEILKISRLESGLYSFIHQVLNQPPKEGSFSHFEELEDNLLFSGEVGEYLVQQAIPLAEIDNRPFDMRLLVQKDHSGQWRRTGLAARLAGKDSITTHVLYGGVRLPAEKVLREAANRFGFSRKKTKAQLNKIASLIPKVIEKSYGQSFGEMEMDVGVDYRGKVWFLEANSKPFRFDERLIRGKSLVRLIHYVHYLDKTMVGGP